MSMPATADWKATVRGLYLVAMAVFLVTIGIGILNGADVVDFDRNQILTHVHSGTLGWITMSIIAASAWYARGISRPMAISFAVVIPVYVLAFYTGNPTFRELAGGVLLVVILWLVVWAWQLAMSRPGLPALAIAIGLTTFTYGAIIGVLRQIQLAGGPSPFPATADVVGAHASAMVFSYLIVVAMGLLEWRVLGTENRPRAGVVQLVLLFIGGALLSITLLFLSKEAQQPVGGLYLLMELIAVILFATRVLPTAIRGWGTSAAGRHIATSAVFVIIAIAIFMYLVFRFITDPNLDVNNPNITGTLIASDHSAFVGVITNLMLGLLLVLTGDRVGRRAGLDTAAYWGMNVGLVIFLVGLVANVAIVKEIGAPLMGISLLLALALAAERFMASDLSVAEAPAAA
jgi:hypothetical protein